MERLAPPTRGWPRRAHPRADRRRHARDQAPRALGRRARLHHQAARPDRAAAAGAEPPEGATRCRLGSPSRTRTSRPRWPSGPRTSSWRDSRFSSAWRSPPSTATTPRRSTPGGSAAPARCWHRARPVPDADVELIRRAAPLHDIGKIGISDLILLKPGKLTEREFELVKSHTTIGAEILAGSQSPLLRLAAGDRADATTSAGTAAAIPRGLAGESDPAGGQDRRGGRRVRRAHPRAARTRTRGRWRPRWRRSWRRRPAVRSRRGRGLLEARPFGAPGARERGRGQRASSHAQRQAQRPTRGRRGPRCRPGAARRLVSGSRCGRCRLTGDRFWELSTDMMCVAGFDGHFRRLNPAWTRTLGWTQEELRSRPVHRVRASGRSRADRAETASLSRRGLPVARLREPLPVQGRQLPRAASGARRLSTRRA